MLMDAVFSFGGKEEQSKSFERQALLATEAPEDTTTTTATAASTTTMTSTTSTASSTIPDDSINDPGVLEEVDDEIYDDDDDNDALDASDSNFLSDYTDPQLGDVYYCMWFENGAVNEVYREGPCLNLKKSYICQKPKNDLLAPGPITDIDVQHFVGSYKDPLGSFHIEFTATGNDQSIGQADRYEVRMVATEKGKEALREDFDKGYHLQDSDFSNEIDSRPDRPKRSGYLERQTIRFEDIASCPRNQLMDLMVLVDTTTVMKLLY